VDMKLEVVVVPGLPENREGGDHSMHPYGQAVRMHTVTPRPVRKN